MLLSRILLPLSLLVLIFASIGVRADSGQLATTVTPESKVAFNLNCVLRDQYNNPVCVTVINSGPGNTAHVAVGDCGLLAEFVGVPKSSNRPISSPCYYNDWYWLVTTPVPWGDIDDCDLLQVEQYPCPQ